MAAVTYGTTTANALLDALFRNVNPSFGTLYISLHTGNPGTTGASEATGGSYVRQAITCSAASSAAITNSANLTFAGMPAGTFTHWGGWTASTAGTYRCGGALVASKVAGSGDTIQISTGEFDITIP